MDLEQTNKRKRNTTQQPIGKEKANKDLLRLQRDIFALKKSQQNESEYVIRKLMAKKQKPQITPIQQSPLLSRLKQFMPIFHKSNEQLQQRPIQQSQKIDVRLQQCQSSSSQSESDNEQIDEEKQQTISTNNNETESVKINNNMDVEKQNKLTHPFSQMQDEKLQQNGKEFVEINFLRYPYMKPEQIQEQLKAQNKQKPQQKDTKKKPLIQDITSQ